MEQRASSSPEPSDPDRDGGTDAAAGVESDATAGSATDRATDRAADTAADTSTAIDAKAAADADADDEADTDAAADHAVVRHEGTALHAGRDNLRDALWPPRFSRNQVVVGVLLAILGAALAIQVRATNSGDQLLRAARPDDLVHILDEVNARGQRLDTELRDLENSKTQLQNSTDKAQAALQQAQDKAKALEILAGTVKAAGPGITVTIDDPAHKVDAAGLLNTLQELRAAGAEVAQINTVRIVVSTGFLDAAAGKVAVDGQTLTGPYVFKVIGDPSTLQPALGIPGGVIASMRSQYGATVTVSPGRVTVDAVAAAPNPQYAKGGGG